MNLNVHQLTQSSAFTLTKLIFILTLIIARTTTVWDKVHAIIISILRSLPIFLKIIACIFFLINWNYQTQNNVNPKIFKCNIDKKKLSLSKEPHKFQYSLFSSNIIFLFWAENFYIWQILITNWFRLFDAWLICIRWPLLLSVKACSPSQHEVIPLTPKHLLPWTLTPQVCDLR